MNISVAYTGYRRDHNSLAERSPHAPVPSPDKWPCWCLPSKRLIVKNQDHPEPLIPLARAIPEAAIPNIHRSDFKCGNCPQQQSRISTVQNWIALSSNPMFVKHRSKYHSINHVKDLSSQQDWHLPAVLSVPMHACRLFAPSHYPVLVTILYETAIRP